MDRVLLKHFRFLKFSVIFVPESEAGKTIAKYGLGGIGDALIEQILNGVKETCN